MQFKRGRELKRTKIEIIPMIDAIFFLLVFFMLSSLSLTRLDSFHVNLPPAASAGEQREADLTLSIDQERNIFINKEPVAIADLKARLSDRIAGKDPSTLTFIINADASVPHGLVVQCIDISQEAGINHFAIATSPEKNAG
jgi:biopolymer transport protein ExbD